LDERREIFILQDKNIGVRGIARALNRSASTISRELKRNTTSDEDAAPRYSYFEANTMYIDRRRVKKGGKFQYSDLTRYVVDNLTKRWSPEQISGRIEYDHPADQTMRVSFASIYRWIKLKYINVEAKAVLRRRGVTKKPKINRFPGAKSVRIRPEEASSRTRLGDWEMDTIVSAKRDMSGILTMCDRMSRYCIIRYMRNNKNQTTVKRTIIDISGKLPFHTATSDQGVEFSCHKTVEAESDIKFYVCDPRSPWQKGSVENLNGLIRDFFPKGTNFRDVSEDDLQDAMELLNNRPRKYLGWKTPIEALNEQLTAG